MTVESGVSDGSSGSSGSSERVERDLGVIEAITVVTRSCPSGVVVAAAERALDAIKAEGPDALRNQAYFVLTAIQGWRGDRAKQVHRSLTHYLDQHQLDQHHLEQHEHGPDQRAQRPKPSKLDPPEPKKDS